ncbi:MAG: translation initiation factor IF-2 subunit beta [Candidatus Nanoarchaeia archaeon]|jgi:translation initiation factor 2 subunit 2|nr:translation initiation factor IF-2 subunit beta [Candidatus Nanoarchaeia archaeon]|tara:strand:+ start:10829 stop:11248 length:420 start_codon:yes stop_codon:yes gene_type:complete
MAWNYKYDELLKKAYASIPKVSEATSRFEVPTISGGFEGNRTLVSNLNQISSKLGRDVKHLLRFMLKALATTGEWKGSKFYFIGKFNSRFLNEKIEKYVKEFVTCTQCGKPDTELHKEKGITFKQCQACGARSSVRSIK